MEEAPTRAILKRQTAYKVWIQDIHSAETIVDETSGLPYYALLGKQVVRVHIIGSIIDAFFSDGYGSIVIDDGSGQIRLKVWGDDLPLLREKNIGDFVLIIGRIAEFNNERYIRPEIVRGVSYDWGLLRRLELIKEYGPLQKKEKVVLEKDVEVAPEVEPSLIAREKILAFVEKQEEVSEEELFTA